MFTHFEVQGGIPLRGEVTISGAKNGALPLIYASLLIQDKVTLHNIPDISDVHATISIIEHLGGKTAFENNTLTIDNSETEYKDIPHEMVSRIRASIWLFGSMLGRFGKVKTSFPGGCVIGKRPTRSHTRALEDLGATLHEDNDCIEMQAAKLKGATIVLHEMSVSATINTVMAAVFAEGETIIKVAAPEPEVQAVCNFLTEMGAHIIGIGTNTIVIRGVESLHGGEFTNIPDRIEAGTFACLGAYVDGSMVKLNNIDNEHLDMFWARMKEIGVDFELPDRHSAIVKAKEEYKAYPIMDTRVYPHFATDLQAPFSLLLTKARGMSKVFETIFEGRLGFLDELSKMGATTQILNPHQAIIVGPTDLKGADLQSFDLRAGATIVLAALGAKGMSHISGINYIDRGYENFEKKLTKLGANIKRIEK